MERTDPMTCPFGEDYPEIGRVLCTRSGKVWVNCREGAFGEPPMCAYEEPDNSPEACERRLARMGGGGRAEMAETMVSEDGYSVRECFDRCLHSDACREAALMLRDDGTTTPDELSSLLRCHECVAFTDGEGFAIVARETLRRMRGELRRFRTEAVEGAS